MTEEVLCGPRHQHDMQNIGRKIDEQDAKIDRLHAKMDKQGSNDASCSNDLMPLYVGATFALYIFFGHLPRYRPWLKFVKFVELEINSCNFSLLLF